MKSQYATLEWRPLEFLSSPEFSPGYPDLEAKLTVFLKR